MIIIVAFKRIPNPIAPYAIGRCTELYKSFLHFNIASVLLAIIKILIKFANLVILPGSFYKFILKIY